MRSWLNVSLLASPIGCDAHQPSCSCCSPLRNSVTGMKSIYAINKRTTPDGNNYNFQALRYWNHLYILAVSKLGSSHCVCVCFLSLFFFSNTWMYTCSLSYEHLKRHIWPPVPAAVLQQDCTLKRFSWQSDVSKANEHRRRRHRCCCHCCCCCVFPLSCLCTDFWPHAHHHIHPLKIADVII